MYHIFFTFDQFSTAGGGQVILRQLEQISKISTQKAVLFCPEGDLAIQAEAYCKIITFSQRNSMWQKAEQLKTFLASQRENISHCELNIHGISALPAAIIGSLFNPIRRVYTEHVMTSQYRLESPLRDTIQKCLLFFLLQFVTTVVCVSKAVKEYMRTTMLIPERKLKVVYNPMPTVPHYKVTHKTKDTYHIATIGALAWIKNVPSLLRIIHGVSQSKPVILHVFGAGPQEEIIKKMITDLNMANVVKLHGVVPHHEVHTFLEENPIDLYVQTSLSESFGYAIAEAMATGIPAIAYSVGGIPELILNNKNGILVAPYDETAFSDAIIALLNDTTQRALLGAAARTTITEWVG